MARLDHCQACGAPHAARSGHACHLPRGSGRSTCGSCGQGYYRPDGHDCSWERAALAAAGVTDPVYSERVPIADDYAAIARAMRKGA